MKVLSIDWDYYMDLSERDRISKFPEGSESYGGVVSDLVWITHYANKNNNLEKVGIKELELSSTVQAVKSLLTPRTVICVAESHKEIVGAVDFRYTYPHNRSGLTVVNIDHHHDAWDFNNKNIDCGNWVNVMFKTSSPYLVSRKLNKYIWIGNNDSNREVVTNWVVKPSWYSEGRLSNLKSYLGNSIDMLFICRSDPWSPPHLDYRLEEFITEVSVGHSVISVDSLRNRYNDHFKHAVQEYSQQIEEISKTQQITHNIK